MNKTQTKALKASIKHWERMRDDPECKEEPYSEDCPCCQEYTSMRCEGCPISEAVDSYGCDNTPYAYARGAFEGYGKDSPEFKEAAQDEIDFLNEVLNQ